MSLGCVSVERRARISCYFDYTTVDHKPCCDTVDVESSCASHWFIQRPRCVKTTTTLRRADPVSPLLQQAREESDARARVHPSEREWHTAHVSCRLRDTRSRMSRYERTTCRDMVHSRERPVADERRRTEKQRQIEFLTASLQEERWTKQIFDWHPEWT